MNKVLVLSAFYPGKEKHDRMFVHVRNLYYQKNGFDVTVINFSCKEEYYIDGIRVIPECIYINEKKKYDLLISHASNIRNQFLFIKKYKNEFKRIIYFFHGHEILKLNKDYPKPYSYMKKNILRNIFQLIYDSAKINIWKKFFLKTNEKNQYIFVSNWIYSKFLEYMKFQDNQGIREKCSIINNSVGDWFEKENYDLSCEKLYDFITIRSNLDGSKYCIDLVAKLAKLNPSKKFLIIGKGKYFSFNPPSSNITLINKTLNHYEMKEYLDKSKCALLPTREDTQGVMTCEMITYGIPTITSNINVCKEFFENIPGVRLIDNELLSADLTSIENDLLKELNHQKCIKWFANNTLFKEVKLIKLCCECDSNEK